MQYKIGDKVRVRNDLIIGNIYGGPILAKGMGRHRGNIVTIVGIDEHDFYIIGEDDVYYGWTDKMFEPIEKN